LQAQKALGRSGRVFGGTLMIGVAVCDDPSAVEASQLETSVLGGITNNDASRVHTLNSSLVRGLKACLHKQ
jgi:hypothetical protein